MLDQCERLFWVEELMFKPRAPSVVVVPKKLKKLKKKINMKEINKKYRDVNRVKTNKLRLKNKDVRMCDCGVRLNFNRISNVKRHSFSSRHKKFVKKI